MTHGTPGAEAGTGLTSGPANIEPPRRIPLFNIPPTPGIWLGFVGLAMFLVAAFLPWYSILARFPTTEYREWTLIIQFDGVNGLYVESRLKQELGVGVPAVGFPLVIIFAIGTFMKVRKLIRSTSHKIRSASLFRGSLNILIPVVITIAVISQFGLFVPGDAPPEVKDLGNSIASQPFGGQREMTFRDDLGFAHDGSVTWGFGPALWVMVAAAVIMNVGSQLEKRMGRKALEQLRGQRASGQGPS